MQFTKIDVLFCVKSEQSAIIAMTDIMKYNTYVDRLFLDYNVWLNNQQQYKKLIRTRGEIGTDGMSNKYTTLHGLRVIISCKCRM